MGASHGGDEENTVAKNERSTEPARTRREPSAPKGRPTPGRKQRNAEARARAKRHRRIVRLWWAGLILVVLGTLTALILTGSAGGAGVLG